jgi:transcription elongation factor Elf1
LELRKPSGPITLDRAERIARGHACENCGEYNYKRLVIEQTPPSKRTELGETWRVTKTCGVCGQEHEMGISATGEVVYVT